MTNLKKGDLIKISFPNEIVVISIWTSRKVMNDNFFIFIEHLLNEYKIFNGNEFLCVPKNMILKK